MNIGEAAKKSGLTVKTVRYYDEINLIKKGFNYGWNIASYGTKYKNNESLRPSLQIHKGLLLSEEVADSLSLTLSKLV